MAAAVKDTVNNLLEKLNIGSKEDGVPPKEPSESEVKTLREKYEKNNQGHVFTFWDNLDVAGKAALYGQLAGIDPKHVNEITERALNPPKKDESNENNKLEPLPESAVASILDSKLEDLDSWYESGLELISQSKVAVVLMAGGQGTRLGSSDPKGCYDIGLPSRKSLFQMQGERIAKIQQLAQKKHKKDTVVVPWYVMTSGPTRAPTEQYFAKHNYFGLPKENVMIFEQGVLPCISNDGKILLESKSKVGL
jgi:UDP-N-acetylglucosamine/UDP-N-acetylgalactosamine diphosphorylase